MLKCKVCVSIKDLVIHIDPTMFFTHWFLLCAHLQQSLGERRGIPEQLLAARLQC